MSTLFITLLAFALVGYTAWVTALIVRSNALNSSQKVLQTALAWFVPLLGALLVHLVNRSQEREGVRSSSGGVEPQTDQGVSPVDFTHHG